MSAERIIIQIMPGEVEAQAEVRPGEPADRTALDEALKAQGVVYGINEEACDYLAGCLEDADFAIEEIVVASGTPPHPGRPGVLDLQFNPELLAGRLRNDGTLDFRDRGLLVPVEPGDVIALYAPPTQPSAGKSVAGHDLIPPSPHDPKPELGQGVELMESGEIRATAAGIVSYQEDAVLTVTTYFEHRGNVDLGSGDLQMEGTLVVSGDVASHACASATADLVVKGMVDGGTVRANGSVTIGEGVIGSDTGFVVAGGDLACNHADSGDLRCGGTISIAANAIKTRITARRVVVGKSKGSVVGGEIRAAERIQVVDVGSKLCTRTLLAIGPIQDHRFPLEAGGTTTSSRIRVVGTDLELLPKAAVLIIGTAHPGVVIKLGRHEIQLQEEVRSVRFSYDPTEESGIRMDPLRG